MDYLSGGKESIRVLTYPALAINFILILLSVPFQLGRSLFISLITDVPIPNKSFNDKL